MLISKVLSLLFVFQQVKSYDLFPNDNNNNKMTAADRRGNGLAGQVIPKRQKSIKKIKAMNISYQKEGEEEDDDYNDDKFEKEEIDPLCQKDNHKIQNSGDLINLNTKCSFISGNVVINNYQDSVLELGSLSSIGGDLKISNISNLVRISAPSLTNIGGSFYLNELTSLTSIHFPYLKTVNTIQWRILPILSTIGFESGLDRINNIMISDTSLVGFSLKEKVKQLNTLDLNNNRFLESISCNVENITSSLSIAANARNVKVSFPELEKITNLTLRDTSNVEFPNIKEIYGSAKFYENYFQSLKLSKLKSIGGTLSIIENNNLQNSEFSNLNEIGGGLMISNNSNVDKINFFPKLKIIGGGIQFDGNFKETPFPKLELVKGSALIRTTSNSFDCSKWTNTDNLIIRGGNIVCASGNQQEVLNYDSNDVKGTLTKSKTGNTSFVQESVGNELFIDFKQLFFTIMLVSLNFF